MQKHKRKLVIAASLLVLLWAWYTVDTTMKLQAAKQNISARALNGLTWMYQRLENESLHYSEYGRLRGYAIEPAHDAVQEYASVTGTYLSHIDLYVSLCDSFAYLVSEQLISSEEQEALRVRLREYAAVTPFIGQNPDQALERIKEVERSLEELMDSSEEARRKCSELQYDMAVLKG